MKEIKCCFDKYTKNRDFRIFIPYIMIGWASMIKTIFIPSVGLGILTSILSLEKKKKFR